MRVCVVGMSEIYSRLFLIKSLRCTSQCVAEHRVLCAQEHGLLIRAGAVQTDILTYVFSPAKCTQYRYTDMAAVDVLLLVRLRGEEPGLPGCTQLSTHNEGIGSETSNCRSLTFSQHTTEGRGACAAGLHSTEHVELRRC